MLSINSDVELSSWPATLDLFQVFNDLGLECSYSFWFFGDGAVTWRLFDEDGRLSDEAPAAFDFIRSGVIDTLHSLGGSLAGNGCAFDRQDIADGYRTLREEGVTWPVYTNHGTKEDTQNIGPNGQTYYQEGDLPGAERYHLDLTLAHGARFFWTDADLHIEPEFRKLDGAAPLFATQVCRDGNPIVRFRRYMGPGNLGPWPGCIAEQMAPVLNQRPEGYLVVYQHLGIDRDENGKPMSARPPYFPAEGMETLRSLAAEQDEGRLLVTTTGRLLRHALMMKLRPWRIRTRIGRGIEVDFESRGELDGVPVRFEWRDFDGWCVPAPARSTNIARLDGEQRPLETFTVDGVTYAGFPWRKLDIGPLLRRARAAGWPPALSDETWRRTLGSIDLPPQVRRLADKHAARGLDYFRRRLARLAFAGDRALDAGCGTGTWALALAERFDEVVALDQDDDMIAVVAALVEAGAISVHPCKAPVSRIPFEDDSFDAIWCSGMIFVTDFRKALAEFRRVLKTTGRIYLTINGADWWTFLIEKRGHEKPEHITMACDGFLNLTFRMSDEDPAIRRVLAEAGPALVPADFDRGSETFAAAGRAAVAAFGANGRAGLMRRAIETVMTHGNADQKRRMLRNLRSVSARGVHDYEIEVDIHPFELDQMSDELARQGFRVVAGGREGHVVLDTRAVPVDPIYSDEQGVFEIVAEKGLMH